MWEEKSIVTKSLYGKQSASLLKFMTFIANAE